MIKRAYDIINNKATYFGFIIYNRNGTRIICTTVSNSPILIARTGILENNTKKEAAKQYILTKSSEYLFLPISKSDLIINKKHKSSCIRVTTL